MFSDDMPTADHVDQAERVELRSTLLEHRPKVGTRECRACGQQTDEAGRCSTAADAHTRLLELLQQD
ncbi:hypothetical protein [Plantactinospora sp. BB1]|uniref:hypothetical protein n=1 Tax=Plantactinospora sp. BB1 TaxID=2071627 RepID=UPI000D159519|nr:hypothetical protein [Plantactinospora sp. BB1]AVT37407.1 hypothetical protein C6W10_14065 [Plantactinospora sp. BB1]